MSKPNDKDLRSAGLPVDHYGIRLRDFLGQRTHTLCKFLSKMLRQPRQHRAVYQPGFLAHVLWLLLNGWLPVLKRRTGKQMKNSLFTRLSTQVVRHTVMMLGW